MRAEFANPDKKIMPGMFGHVDFSAGKRRAVVTAPRTRSIIRSMAISVYVVAPDDKAKGFDGPLHVERRAVTASAMRRGDRVVILSASAPGERIVTEGQIKLQPGAAVRIEIRCGDDAAGRAASSVSAR